MCSFFWSEMSVQLQSFSCCICSDSDAMCTANDPYPNINFARQCMRTKFIRIFCRVVFGFGVGLQFPGARIYYVSILKESYSFLDLFEWELGAKREWRRILGG